MLSFIRSLLSTPNLDEHEQKKEIITSVYALLVEVARSDRDFSAEEKTQIDLMCMRYFKLTQTELIEIELHAKTQLEQSVDLYQLTKNLRKSFSVEERTEILEMIWAIVFTDGRIDPYEEQLVRKLCDLIGLQHQHYMQAKHAASQKATKP